MARRCNRTKRVRHQSYEIVSYKATVFQAMIASPSDVASERHIIRAVVAEWTAVHSADKAAVLLPVAWESHSTPEMGDRPQGIINKRLLAGCDLLIAAFWTKIGSPTGKAVSGTVEEIEEHVSAGKSAMIYFSEVPVRLDSVDAQQYEQLLQFKNSCRERGLYEIYDSLTEFKEKLTRQIAQSMIRLLESEELSRTANEATRSAMPNGLQVHIDQLSAPRRTGLSLSPTASTMLKAMSKDSGANLLRLGTLSGLIIQVGRQAFNEQGNARDTARCEAALSELERANLIRAMGHKRELFELTNDGYEAADQIAEP